MERLKNLFNQPEFHTLLFCLGFVVFNWLFWGLFHLQQPELIFIYLFFNWGIAILLLFVISRSCDESPPRDSGKPAKDD